jgi:hypothetical protein
MIDGQTIRTFSVLRSAFIVAFLCRMFKKAVQRGRSEDEAEAYPLWYVETSDEREQS